MVLRTDEQRPETEYTPTTSSPPMRRRAATDDEKRYWEVRKLRAETRALRRSPLRNPNIMLTGVTALVGVIGMYVQYTRSNKEYQLAQIKTEQAKLEIEQLDAQRTRATELLEQAKRDVAATQQRRADAERRLAIIDSTLKVATAAIEASGSRTAAPVAAAVQHAATQLQAAKNASQAEDQESRRSLQRLERLQREVAAPAAAAQRTVYLQVGRGGDEVGHLRAMRDLQAALQGAGYQAPGIERVSEHDGSTVRYFHDADLPAANAVADLIAATLPSVGRPKVWKPGYAQDAKVLEVWIDFGRTP
jgi:hypothetical protein